MLSCEIYASVKTFESQLVACTFFICQKPRQEADLPCCMYLWQILLTHITVLGSYRPHCKHRGKSHVSKFIQLSYIGSDAVM